MLDHDTLFKSILLRPRFLRDFFLAFLPEVQRFADLDHLDYIDKEHPPGGKTRRRTGDVLARTTIRGEQAAFLIHIEHQSHHEKHALARLGEYTMRDHRRYDLPAEQNTLTARTAKLKLPPHLNTAMPKIINPWKEVARREALKEGRMEGQQALTLRMLNRKLGQIPASLEKQVRALSGERIEALAEALLYFDSLTDVKRWLKG